MDYADTKWRPALHPLPCRQSVARATGADGRHSFFVRKTIQSGTVLEVSLCLEVGAVAVDQFPFLRDYVLIGEMENGNVGCQQTFDSSHAHNACTLQIKFKRILENLLWRFCISFLSTNAQTGNHPNLLRIYLGFGFMAFVRVDMKYDYMFELSQCL